MRSIILLFPFILVTACGEQNKPERIESDPLKANLSVPDEGVPFTESDTVSAYGPKSITRNILQDRNGNIWFATWQGIICYDGKVFTNYTLKLGLQHFNIFSILEDRKGNMWFGTVGGGIYQYNGSTFLRIDKTKGLAGNIVSCMLEDNAGHIWFGTNEGVSCYNGTAFINYTTNDGLLHNFIYAMIEDKKGNIWFGSQGGLSYYNRKPLSKFIKLNGLSLRGIRSLLQDKEGNMWVGDLYALCRFDPLLAINTGKADTSIISNNSVLNISADKKGNLWLSSGERNNPNMILFKYNGISFTPVKAEKQIFGAIEDGNGNIWFGTEKGVYRYNGELFEDFRKD